MKPGKNPAEFLAELQRQAANKRDFVAASSKLAVLDDNRLAIEDLAYPMNDNFQAQAAGVLDYPVQFWRRSRDQYPDAWRHMVNSMLSTEGKDHLIRTLDGTARAFLSNRYRRIDHDQVATSVLSAIGNMSGWQVVSAEINESNMYLKVLTPLIRDVSVGEPVQAGFSIRNSETGEGRYTVERLVYFLRCTNGMIAPGAGLKRSHLGSAFDADGSTRELFSDETKRLTDAALMAQTVDVIKAAADDAQFALLVDQIGETQGRKIENPDVPKVVEVTANRFGFNETEKNAVLRNLIEGASLTQWGLFNAVTLAAHQDEVTPDYERSIELERVGGTLMSMTPKDWIEISAAK